MRQEGVDLRFAPLLGRAQVVKEEVALDPVAVRLLGTGTQVADADRRVELGEELGAGGRRSGLGDEPWDATVVSDPSQRVWGAHPCPSLVQ